MQQGAEINQACLPLLMGRTRPCTGRQHGRLRPGAEQSPWGHPEPQDEDVPTALPATGSHSRSTSPGEQCAACGCWGCAALECFFFLCGAATEARSACRGLVLLSLEGSTTPRWLGCQKSSMKQLSSQKARPQPCTTHILLGHHWTPSSYLTSSTDSLSNFHCSQLLSVMRQTSAFSLLCLKSTKSRRAQNRP